MVEQQTEHIKKQIELPQKPQQLDQKIYPLSSDDERIEMRSQLLNREEINLDSEGILKEDKILNQSDSENLAGQVQVKKSELEEEADRLQALIDWLSTGGVDTTKVNIVQYSPG